MGFVVVVLFLQCVLNVFNCGVIDYFDLVVDGVFGLQVLVVFDVYFVCCKFGGEGVLLKVIEVLQGECYMMFVECWFVNEVFFYGWFVNWIG